MESEALLETEGEFLVRVSTKIVLSGIAQGASSADGQSWEGI